MLHKSKHYKELAQIFLKLGTIGFGGPAAHLAMMEYEVVEKRKWISKDELLDYISAANLIPGPNSTEVAIHIGYKMGGAIGLIIAGICFILPAALIVTFIAWVYVTYGRLPGVQAILYGIKPVIIAVVLQALWSLGKTALKSWTLIFLCGLSFTASFFGVNELLIMFLSGCISVLNSSSFSRYNVYGAMTPLLSKPIVVTSGVAGAITLVNSFTLTKLFLFFLKIGSVLFGSGYVLVAFLRSDLVERWHWLNENQLLDALAVGQFTPGPVFTTATFIGYLLAGSKGAAIATIGIFLPAFLFVAVSSALIPKLRRSEKARSFLNGLNVASIAIMGFAAFFFAKAAIIDWLSIVVSVVSAILLIRYKINSAWLVGMGGVTGFLAGFYAS